MTDLREWWWRTQRKRAIKELERRSHMPFCWLMLGIIAGGVAVVALSVLFINQPACDAGKVMVCQ